MKHARIRLYVDHPLGQGQSVPVDSAQAHYLFGVMRLKAGGYVTLFNGRDGEFVAVIETAGKRRGMLMCEDQTRPLSMPPDLWLLFAPVKKARTDFIVEKAVEMGVARIVPVRTDFTNAERLRHDKQQAHAVEAAEQCGATYVPEVSELTKLDSLLADWPADRQIMFCDEKHAGDVRTLPKGNSGKWAILIGPEGGFSQAERARLTAMRQAHSISLGPRILRAETAVVAALTLWQSTLGDWV